MSKFCSQCGNELKDNYNVCPRCGYNLNTNSSDVKYINQVQNTNHQTKTNTMAILGFVFSLLMTGILGLVFSIIGLSQIKKTNEEGKGFAVAGIIISIVKIALLIISMLVNIFFVKSIISGFDYDYDDDFYYPKTTEVVQSKREFMNTSIEVVKYASNYFNSDITEVNDSVKVNMCFKYKIEDTFDVEDGYTGWVWIIQYNQFEYDYGISMKNNEYFIEEDDDAYDIDFDDIERVSAFTTIYEPFGCIDNTSKHMINQIENTSI